MFHFPGATGAGEAFPRIGSIPNMYTFPERPDSNLPNLFTLSRIYFVRVDPPLFFLGRGVGSEAH